MNHDNSFRITLDIKAPESHRVKVRIEAIQGHLPEVLAFPVWTPGSYLVREFSRHITNFVGGRKVQKNEWELDSKIKHVEYEVYCFERTVRTSYIDSRNISLNGANLLPILRGKMEIELRLPTSWKILGTSLKHNKKSPGTWLLHAQNDDEWIDSPIVAAAPGQGGQFSFISKGKQHRVTWVGTSPAKEKKELSADIKKISDTTQSMFGGAPFYSYDYLFDFLPRGYGGLEHRSSQLSHFDGSELADPKRYQLFLGLVAHEYFHAWNVKSIRPEALGPFDYFRENYTEELWFAEGITSYFDDKIVHDAGLLSAQDYKALRISQVNQVREGTPGIYRRSLAESSFDAWIRYYRPDEDTPNSSVSYYEKGSVLGWCWDAHLQKKSRGRWNLTKLLKAIWKEFGIHSEESLREAKPGFSQDELLDFCARVSRVEHRTVFDWIHSRKPLPWRMAANHFKLKVQRKVVSQAAQFLGLTPADREGRVVAGIVFSGSAAEKQGIAPNDEIIAIDEERVLNSASLEQILRRAKDNTIQALLSRSGRVFTTELRLRAHADLGVDYELIP
jgi:predicted metalloprotease with PDZ domain